MACAMINKVVVTTRLGLACRLLSTKSSLIKGDNKWNFLTDQDTFYSIGEEFIRRRFSESEECKGRRYSSRGLEILVDVRGFGRENLDIKVSEKMLLINGMSKDYLGEKIHINKRIPLVVPKGAHEVFFDPTGVRVEERHGQVKVVFPLTGKEMDKPDANYWVWVSA